MRLLVVGHSYVTAFAQEKFVAMKALDPRLQFCLVIPGGSNSAFMSHRAEVHPRLDPAAVVVARRILGSSHMTYVLDPLRFARTLRRFRPEVVLIEEDPHSLLGVEAAFLTRWLQPQAKLVLFLWDNLARRPKFPLSLLKRRLTRYTLSRCSLVICGNSEAQALLGFKKGYLGASTILPQVGIDPMPQERPGGNPAVPVIGFVGRLVPEKGVGLLLSALSRLQHLAWKLVIVGAGPLYNKLEAVWKPIFGERLVIRRAVAHREVPACLQSLDIFVLPSYGVPEWKEQFGLTLVQAMMAEVACIGSSSGAIPEVLGRAGLIFEEGDAGSLAAALASLLESPEKRRGLAAAARQRALSEYSTQVVASRYLTALTGLAALPPGGRPA
jgi:glycosyltransferase involved in cell wall biosynthesis